MGKVYFFHSDYVLLSESSLIQWTSIKFSKGDICNKVCSEEELLTVVIHDNVNVM